MLTFNKKKELSMKEQRNLCINCKKNPRKPGLLHCSNKCYKEGVARTNQAHN